MQTISVTHARANIFNLIQKIHETHEPLLITGKHANAVMISEEDWRSIQETIYLSSVPGMVASIVEGLNMPDDACDDNVKW